MEVKHMLSAEEQQKMNLLQKLDRGIDDVLSGRVMSYEEARAKIEQFRQIRKNERAKSEFNE